jgi:hypothetical protein
MRSGRRQPDEVLTSGIATTRETRFQGAPPDTMRVWVSRRRNLADAPTGRMQIFDFYFMPVTNHIRQFPTPPEVERYRRKGGVQRNDLSGWALLRPGFPARLARPADGPEVWIRGGRRIAANLAYRPDRSLAATQVHRRARRPAQSDKVPSDRPAAGSCLRSVTPLPGRAQNGFRINGRSAYLC